MAGLGGPMAETPQAQPGMAQPAPAPAPAPEPGMNDEEQGEPATDEEQALYADFVEAAMDVLYPKGETAQVAPMILEDLRGQVDPKVLAIFDGAQPPVDPSKPQDMVAALSIMLLLLVDKKLGYGEKMRAQAQEDAMPTGASRAPQGKGHTYAIGKPAMPKEQPSEPVPGTPIERDGGSYSIGVEADEPPPPPDYSAILLHGGKTIVEELIEIAEAAKIHDFTEQDVEGVTFRAMDLFNIAGQNTGGAGYDKDALAAEFGGIVEADRAGQLGSILPGLPGGAPMQEGR